MNSLCAHSDAITLVLDITSYSYLVADNGKLTLKT
jgi:hypothetical protein